MLNPWESHLLNESIHELDKPYIEAYNRNTRVEDYKIETELLQPIPYLGNPEAKVIWLLANPGLSATDSMYSPLTAKVAHESRLHINKTIYPLLSELDENPGLLWMKSKLSPLIRDVGLETVAHNLFIAEFHPYHSKQYAQIPYTLPTQQYTFDLVKNAVQSGALVIIGRLAKEWKIALPELEHADLLEPSSIRNAVISPKNFGFAEYKTILSHLYT